MVKVRVETTIALPIDAALAAVGDLALRYERAEFRDGVLVDPRDHSLRNGCLIVDGEHPRGPVRFVVVTGHQEAADSGGLEQVRTESAVDLVAEPAVSVAWSVDARELSNGRTWTSTGSIESPNTPQRLTCDYVTEVDGHWFVRGQMTAEAQATVDRTGRSAGRIEGRMSVNHRRGCATVEIAIGPPSALDATAVRSADVSVKIIGRRWVRPLVAVGGLFAKRFLRRTIVEFFEDVDAESTSGDAIADDIWNGFLDALV